MARTLYFTTVEGLASTSSLTIFTLAESSVERSSRIGSIALQGGHHSAQKSTSTGLLELSTSASKFWSLTRVPIIVSIVDWRWTVQGVGRGGKGWVCVEMRIGGTLPSKLPQPRCHPGEGRGPS